MGLYPGLGEDLEEVRARRARIIAAAKSAKQKREAMERELEPLVSRILRRMENS